MKITKVEIRSVQLPMVRSFSIGGGTLDRKETVIVSLHTDNGLVGYGESSSFISPFYMRETVSSCMRVQAKHIVPRILGKRFDTASQFRDAYADIKGNQAAKTGPECAFWHVLSQRDNVSLKRLLGGTRDEIPVGDSIGIKPSIDETLFEVNQRLADGYLRIKVKIEPGWDVDLMRAIRRQWPDIELTVDANATYHPEKHRELLKALDTFHLTMIEQPFAANKLAEHAALQKELATPICLDESVKNVEDMEKAEALGACRIVNIKPVRVGGLVESVRIHDFALEHGIGMLCGGTFESGIGRAFNIALASKAGFTLPADMSPYQLYFKEDLIEPSYTVKPNGYIDVPDEPGLGYRIREDAIERLTTEKITLE